MLYNFTGCGKGKSSAALGIALRALGWGWQVGVIQFMKGGRDTGEKLFFQRYFPDMIFEQHGLGLLSREGDHAGLAGQGWERTAVLLKEFPGELLILDELNNALFHGFLDEEEVLAALNERREGLHVIVTGRYAPEALRDISDLVSDVANEKHPLQQGVPAMKGLDF